MVLGHIDGARGSVLSLFHTPDPFDQAMQLTFAFDEVLAFGNRENSSLSNIKTALEMDSNEEKVFKMNQLAQEKQAKELASKRAKEIDQERVARAKSNLMGFGSNTDKRDSYGSSSSDHSRVAVSRSLPTLSFTSHLHYFFSIKHCSRSKGTSPSPRTKRLAPRPPRSRRLLLSRWVQRRRTA
jgi:hypothetical protein